MIKLKDVDEKGEETELESGLDDLFPFVPDRFLKDLKMTELVLKALGITVVPEENPGNTH